MNFEQFFAGIRKRWLLIIGITCLTVATTVGHSLMHSKIYTSHALVLVDIPAIDPLTHRTNPLVATERQQQAFFLNNVFLALSEEIARNIASNDPTINTPEFIEYWKRETDGKGDIVAWYAKLLYDGIVVNLEKDSTIIEFIAYGESPERASMLANIYAKSYISISNTLKQREAESRIAALQVHLKKTKAELDEAWREFVAARRAGGLTYLDELSSDQNIRTMQTSVRISEKTAEKINSENRAKELLKNGNNIPNVAALNFSVGSLTQDISREKARLQEYKSILGPEHPSVKQGAARIIEMQSILDLEIKNTQQQEQQSSDAYQYSTELLRMKLDESKKKTLEETSARNQLTGLIQKIHSLNINYADVYQAEKHETTRALLSFTNLTLLSPAIPPTKAALPNWPLIVSFAAIIGLMIGISASILLERIDGSIYTPKTIEKSINVPLLGIIGNHAAS